ncbi:hypothetical protein LCGC14_2138810, partial [marine sediment metagenome]
MRLPRFARNDEGIFDLDCRLLSRRLSKEG